MAKSTLKRKMRKKKMKNSSNEEDSSSAKKMEVAYDDEDDHEDLNEDITSEEEEGEDDERRRLKLVEAISSLGGKRKKVLGERSEAAVQMSEFSAGGEQEKIDLSDLIGSLDQTPSVTLKTRKQLKTLQQSNRTIETPLSKQETERIQRDLSFQKTASEVSKWKPIITQNQRAEQLVFPLNQESPGPRAVERVVTGWKARTPLEEEIFALLNANKQPINDPVLTRKEEASMKAMSLEEAKIRRAELQKARALQSYYEAKARRERKIKSKKYHKVQNKAKRKDFLKQFDQMVKSDPAAALEELNKMEVARMQERMSLKHQNSGKWAKSKAIMAKYDEGARKAMQQQLEVNKELTQKLVTALNEAEEEEEEEGGDPEVLPDFVNEAEQGVDSSNPWMRGKLSEDPAEKEAMEMVDLTVEEEPAAEEEEEEEEVTEEEALLREFERKRKQRQAEESEEIPVICLDDDEEEKEAGGEEEEQLSEFTNLYKEITDSRREAEAAAAADAVPENSSQLEETLQRIRALEDTEDLIIQEESAAKEDPVPPSAEKNLPPDSQKPGKKRKRKRGIELKEVLTKDTKVIHAPLAQTVEDAEDSDDQDQRGLIREAFAGDDVVSDFLRDKKKQEQAGKRKVVDLTLPGWGEWGGTGLKPSRKKRRKFRIRTAPSPPRKDQHLPSVIISEKRNSSIALHQVNSLPFPFETHAQFESTVRAPLGRTWNTEQTVRKVSKPRVVTQLGAIIEPMAKEELMESKKTTTETPKDMEKRGGSRRRVGSGRRKH